jgi:hypothetical protein
MSFAALGRGATAARVDPAPRAEPAPLQAPRAAAAPEASATGCRAVPGTVYGAEPVVLEVEGPSTPAATALTVVDKGGRVVERGWLSLPGQRRPGALGSGDFELQAGSRRVSCRVTVNRELSRGPLPETR